MDAELSAVAREAMEQLSKDVNYVKKMSEDIDLIFKAMQSSTRSASSWAVIILGELVDEITNDILLETYRTVKLKDIQNSSLGLLPASKELGGYYTGLDIYGQKIEKNSSELVKCNNCSTSVIASRFAPHLEKCMGMGRNASRLARRQIETKVVSPVSSASDEFDDDEDTTDETYSSKGFRKTKRSSSHSPKKLKLKKTDSSSMKRAGTPFEGGGTREELDMFFAQFCGVEASTTGKLCSKSIRCPQHNNEQRRLIRTNLVPGSIDPNTLMMKRFGKVNCNLPENGVPQSAFLDLIDIDGDYGGLSDHSSIPTSAPPSPSSTKSGSPDTSRMRKKKKRRFD
eukprot:CFRG8434T1